MDFLDFKGQDLYFDEPISTEVEILIKQAADEYGSEEAEKLLHKAYFLAPDNLQVHVALYRYYFYQHKLEEAIKVAHNTLDTAAKMLDFPRNWRHISMNDLGVGAIKSMGLIRYYFLALKAAGYINIRIGNTEEGVAMLKKVAELDSVDRLGARALLEVVNEETATMAVNNYLAQ